MTIFLDIDGCILSHIGNMSSLLECKSYILPGVKDKFNEWSAKGYKIILTTSRKESTRKVTEEQLGSFGLFWDMLIMGLSRRRALINDKKDGEDTAVAINLERNEGMESLDI